MRNLFFRPTMRMLGIFLMLIMMVSLLACATLQQKWDKATDDEKARITISQTQKSLKTAFVTSKAFVDANQKYQAEWKTKIIPMFDATNKILKDLIDKGAAGQKLTYISVLAALGNRIPEITAALAAWGLKISQLDDLSILHAWIKQEGRIS